MKNAEILDTARSDFITQHGEMFDKHFPADLDEEAMILKAHLLLEGALRDFCHRSVLQPSHLRGARFQFHQVLSLAQALSVETFNDYAQPMWAVAKKLNKLRNAMAHELEPDPLEIEGHKQSIIALVNQQHDSDDKPGLRRSLEFMFGSFNAFLQINLLLRESGSEKNIID
ncbi:hypothetical protein [Pseudomonas sp. KCJK9058]|jgi:formamidopyrimidine-DNA glycosylase|uniref:hypothetical protein n=1 Tax=Pseudomonas sp. KCJK9058 TaxID=3344563 RepID=UPI003905E61C